MYTVGMVSSGSGQAEVPQPRLVRAAHEFEAQMMKELLRPMTQSESMEGDVEADAGGPMSEFASEALGQALSARGGLGIATSILRSLQNLGPPSRSG